MFKIPYGLYVVTTNVDGRDNGCISNTLAQDYRQPQSGFAVHLTSQNLTCEMIENQASSRLLS